MRRKAGKPKPRSSARTMRDRLHEAEATLEAIRTGQVDALVVSGPRGERTLTIEGAAHPYFVLLDAMSDGAVLLDPGGAILFGNRAFGEIAGKSVETLRGSGFQRLIVPAERTSFDAFLGEGSRQGGAREFALLRWKGSATPVAIALSSVPLGADSGMNGTEPGDGPTVLMAIITDLTARKAAEAMRARLLERLISAEDDERRRIARELHDETGQSLTAILVGLRTIADMSSISEVRAATLSLREVAARSVDDVARLARGLHPAVLDDEGLEAAARRYVRDYARSLRTDVDFTAGHLDSPRLAPMAAATVYRILQEALTNVARHASARTVTVALRRDGAGIELLVQDDGVGFDVRRALDAVSGLGLRGMRERVTLLGGSIQIESRPGRGTVVRARIPEASTAPTSTERARRGPKRTRKESRP